MTVRDAVMLIEMNLKAFAVLVDYQELQEQGFTLEKSLQ